MINYAGEIVVASQSFASALSGSAYSALYVKAMALMATCTVANSTAINFVDGDVGVVANTIAAPAHGWVTGRKVAATNSGGALPAGLTATTYYVIAIDAATIKLASSLANALAGTPVVDITAAAGGGTHTLTPAALSTASVKLQWSNDDTNWYDLTNMSQNISATGTLGFLINDFTAGTGYKSIRAVTAIAAGQVLMDISANVLKYRVP